MKVRRSSWHYKVNYFGSDWGERKHDNLCAYFWRTVGKIFIAVFFVGIFSALGYAFATSGFMMATTIMILFIISIFAVPGIAINLLRKKLGKSPEMPYGNIVVEYLRARKQKMCPLIEYVD